MWEIVIFNVIFHIFSSDSVILSYNPDTSLGTLNTMHYCNYYIDWALEVSSGMLGQHKSLSKIIVEQNHDLFFYDLSVAHKATFVELNRMHSP